MGDGQTLKRRRLEFLDRDLEGGARQLNDRSGKRKLRVKADLCAECALPTNSGYLDGFAGVEGRDERDHSLDWKIGVPDRRISLLKSSFLNQPDFSKMWLQKCEIILAQRSKQQIIVAIQSRHC